MSTENLGPRPPSVYDVIDFAGKAPVFRQQKGRNVARISRIFDAVLINNQRTLPGTGAGDKPGTAGLLDEQPMLVVEMQELDNGGEPRGAQAFCLSVETVGRPDVRGWRTKARRNTFLQRVDVTWKITHY